VTRLPGAVHDKCFAPQECVACYRLLPTPVWVAGAQMIALWFSLLPDLWMCHLLWLNTQKLSILDAIFFCNKCAVHCIIYAHVLKSLHRYISAGNTECVYIKFMPFTPSGCSVHRAKYLGLVPRVRVCGALFLSLYTPWHDVQAWSNSTIYLCVT
jgi:hypothetical protein